MLSHEIIATLVNLRARKPDVALTMPRATSPFADRAKAAASALARFLQGAGDGDDRDDRGGGGVDGSGNGYDCSSSGEGCEDAASRECTNCGWAPDTSLSSLTFVWSALVLLLLFLFAVWRSMSLVPTAAHVVPPQQDRLHAGRRDVCGLRALASFLARFLGRNLGAPRYPAPPEMTNISCARRAGERRVHGPVPPPPRRARALRLRLVADVRTFVAGFVLCICFGRAPLSSFSGGAEIVIVGVVSGVGCFVVYEWCGNR